MHTWYALGVYFLSFFFTFHPLPPHNVVTRYLLCVCLFLLCLCLLLCRGVTLFKVFIHVYKPFSQQMLDHTESSTCEAFLSLHYLSYVNINCGSLSLRLFSTQSSTALCLSKGSEHIGFSALFSF